MGSRLVLKDDDGKTKREKKAFSPKYVLFRSQKAVLQIISIKTEVYSMLCEAIDRCVNRAAFFAAAASMERMQEFRDGQENFFC